jgi:hypothetical protein
MKTENESATDGTRVLFPDVTSPPSATSSIYSRLQQQNPMPLQKSATSTCRPPPFLPFQELGSNSGERGVRADATDSIDIDFPCIKKDYEDKDAESSSSASSTWDTDHYFGLMQPQSGKPLRFTLGSGAHYSTGSVLKDRCKQSSKLASGENPPVQRSNWF